MSGFISVPSFPNVPNLPGVPALLRDATAYLPLPVIALSDELGLGNLFAAQQWGIFNGTGAAVVTPDSVFGFEYQRDFQVSKYPVQQGTFAAYNKVETPYQAIVTMTIGDSVAARTAFITALEAAVASVNIYTVRTPEFTYQNATITHYDYRREAREGATLLKVNVWCEEVRIAPAAMYTQTQAASGADPLNDGTVQTTGNLNPGTGNGASVTSMPLPAPQ